MTSTMTRDVFLSHSHVDKVYADAICHALESSGIRCWVAPRDILPSEDWAESIINAMDICRILLLIFSANSNRSPQVRREVERAVNKGMIVLPFRIENVPLSKSLEYFISTQHWLDGIAGDRSQHLSDLRDCVATLLASPATKGHQNGPSPLQPPAAGLGSSPIPTALTTDAAAPRGIAPDLQEALTAQLAKTLGPIARHLVQRHITAGLTASELVSALSLEIDDERERQAFVTRGRVVLR
jgi:hypothetical protein